MDKEGGGIMCWFFWDWGWFNVLCFVIVDVKVERFVGVVLRDFVLFCLEKDVVEVKKKVEGKDDVVIKVFNEV